MIQDLQKALCQYEAGEKDAFRTVNQALEFLKQHQDLEARVRDPSVNEKFQPVFGTEWCKNLD